MQETTPTSFLRSLEQITEYWSPRIVDRVNEEYVKVAKVKGQLAWHKHEQEDEMFLVVKGMNTLHHRLIKEEAAAAPPAAPPETEKLLAEIRDLLKARAG